MSKIDNILKGIDENYEIKSIEEEREEFVSYWEQNLIPKIAEFYLTESLRVQPPTDNLSFSPYYRANISKVTEERQNALDQLEDFFKKYIFLACLGEARYRSKYDITGKEYAWIPKGCSGMSSRNSAWTKGYKIYLANENKDKLLEKSMVLYELFDRSEWGDCSYGGRKWRNIINHLIEYLSGNIDKLTFVDTAVSLVHNGSLFVDKIIGLKKVTALKGILQVKFTACNPMALYDGIERGFFYSETSMTNLVKYKAFTEWLVQ